MKSIVSAFCLLLAMSSTHPLAAETDPYSLQAAEAYNAQAARTEAPALDPRDKATIDYKLSQDDVYFKVTVLVSVVAFAFLLFMRLVPRKDKDYQSGRDLMRASVVMFIAYCAVVLVLLVPRPETLTGVIGLLSAIVGYLFGRAGRNEGDDGGESINGDKAPKQ
jgi:hypothetical protein